MSLRPLLMFVSVVRLLFPLSGTIAMDHLLVAQTEEGLKANPNRMHLESWHLAVREWVAGRVSTACVCC